MLKDMVVDDCKLGQPTHVRLSGMALKDVSAHVPRWRG